MLVLAYIGRGLRRSSGWLIIVVYVVFVRRSRHRLTGRKGPRISAFKRHQTHFPCGSIAAPPPVGEGVDENKATTARVVSQHRRETGSVVLGGERHAPMRSKIGHSDLARGGYVCQSCDELQVASSACTMPFVTNSVVSKAASSFRWGTSQLVENLPDEMAHIRGSCRDSSARAPPGETSAPFPLG